jgi:DNA invertase Pin-like site-specific DNA recombinase
VIYARKSTDQSELEDEQKSVVRQIANARAFATQKGWTVAENHIYTDDGISGAASSERLRASPTPVSWNQIAGWLKQIDGLPQAA